MKLIITLSLCLFSFHNFLGYANSSYQFCMDRPGPDPILTDTPVPKDGAIALRFRIAANSELGSEASCAANAEWNSFVDASELDCHLDGFTPPSIGNHLTLSRDSLIDPDTKVRIPHPYDFVVVALSPVSYPRACHFRNTDECHAHLVIRCSLKVDPEEEIKHYSILNFKISENSRPQDDKVTCSKSKSTRLVFMGEPHLTKGRLEHIGQNSKVFSSVCADGFGTKEAKVACREMCGVSSYAMEMDAAEMGPVTSEVKMTNFECTGNENKLENCKYSYSRDGVKCESDMTVGVDCESMSVLSTPKLSLRCTDEEYHIKLESKSKEAKIIKLEVAETTCKWSGLDSDKVQQVIRFDDKKCKSTLEENKDRTRYQLHLNVVMRIEEESVDEEEEQPQSLVTQSTFHVSCWRDLLEPDAPYVPGYSSGPKEDENNEDEEEVEISMPQPTTTATTTSTSTSRAATTATQTKTTKGETVTSRATTTTTQTKTTKEETVTSKAPTTATQTKTTKEETVTSRATSPATQTKTTKGETATSRAAPSSSAGQSSPVLSSTVKPHPEVNITG